MYLRAEIGADITGGHGKPTRSVHEGNTRATPMWFLSSSLPDPRCSGMSPFLLNNARTHDVGSTKGDDQELQLSCRSGAKGGYQGVQVCHFYSDADAADISDWPTIPQLYVKGEFVGGCDIVLSSKLHNQEIQMDLTI